MGGLIAEFMHWMIGGGLSHRTIEERIQVLDRLRRFIDREPQDASWEDLSRFLGNNRFAASTRCTYFVHLRAWYRWLVLFDHRVDDPTMKLRSPKMPRRAPKPVTLRQLEVLLESRMHHRTRVMIVLGAYAGLRVHEIAAVRGEHLQFGVLWVRGKGGVEAEIPIHPVIEAAASAMPATGLWFPSPKHPGEPIRSRSVSDMIGRAMRRCGIPPTRTAHSLRHFFGTEALAIDSNLVVVQQLMRHASVATTAGYTQIDDTQRRATIAALPAPRGLRVA